MAIAPLNLEYNLAFMITQEDINNLAIEYAEGMMGEKESYWVHHADKMLFNNLKKAYAQALRVGYNMAVDDCVTNADVVISQEYTNASAKELYVPSARVNTDDLLKLKIE